MAYSLRYTWPALDSYPLLSASIASIIVMHATCVQRFNRPEAITP
jgi:hypothetical protein